MFCIHDCPVICLDYHGPGGGLKTAAFHLSLFSTVNHQIKMQSAIEEVRLPKSVVPVEWGIVLPNSFLGIPFTMKISI